MLSSENQHPITWEEFEEKIGELKEDLRLRIKDAPMISYFQPWLFRGQSDASWSLKTTLERFVCLNKLGKSALFVENYERVIRGIVPTFNSLYGTDFNRNFDNKFSGRSIHWDESCLQLMCYLRHHGFPSPFLDWSESLLVAAFFAFRHATTGQDVAIFALNTSLSQVRGGLISEPLVDNIGPYIETHRRHFMQQSQYTYCSSKPDGKLIFSSHDDAVVKNPNDHPMHKFTIAASERQRVLEKLHEANINAYTLFGSEEGLMDTLAYRHLLRSRP